GPHTITYDTVGAWGVSLTVTDSLGTIITNFVPGLIFVDSCNPIASTQGNWYFGAKAGVNFSSGKAVSVANGQLFSLEGCASISDSSGNLLFYTDGIEVFDINHDTMPSGILNGHPNSVNVGPSASQGVTIVPHPGDTNQYYIFTISDVGTINNGLSYTIVDMTLRGGLGDIDTNNLNISVTGGDSITTEHLAAIPHCNGTDYWIIVHGISAPFNDKLLAYQLTSSGVQLPVLSNSFSVSSSNGQTWIGQIDAAPNGRTVAITSFATNSCHLYDFDKATGKFIQITSFPFYRYGVSFSPNSKVLYLVKSFSLLLTQEYDIDQLDISSINFNPVPTINTIGLSNQQNAFVSFQLGPDEKIYITRRNQKGLSVINYPNELNSINAPNACGFNFSGVQLFQNSREGLPNMIDAKPERTKDFQFNITNCGTVEFHNMSCGTTFLWNFGDGNTDTLQNPSHTYAVADTYWVCLNIVDNIGCSNNWCTVVIANGVPCQRTISGQVSDSAGAIINGIVNLKAYSPNPTQMTIVAVTTIDSLGNYIFTNVSQGQFLVIAAGDSILYPNTVPTYYDSTNHWQKAIIVDASSVCDTIIIANIQLVDFPTIIGFGKISGQITSSGQFKNGKNPIDPVPGIDVVVEEAASGKVIAGTTTDGLGFYYFENIPIGDYKLYVDITGLPMDSTYYFSVTGTDTLFTNLDFLVDSVSITITPLTSVQENLNDHTIKVYPNPYKDFTNIEFTLKETSSVSLEVYNILGVKINTIENSEKQPGHYNYKFSVKDLGYPSGLYLIKLNIDHNSYSLRILEF
ncbi:MAG: T9SS type A sorting domain-containing protein, partial [Bacteroidetes bacterium]|nr:T9SS type A sorting domain-containing protein [Bacteroidota bacterium]